MVQPMEWSGRPAGNNTMDVAEKENETNEAQRY
jgi:hypothetical protein